MRWEFTALFAYSVYATKNKRFDFRTLLYLDDSDYVYEYVYYYYDEEGGNGTVVDIKPASSLTKLANISLADTDLIGRTRSSGFFLVYYRHTM